MKKNALILFSIVLSSSSFAGPVLQMNKAFNALSNVIPYVTKEEQFLDKKNEKKISESLNEISEAFKTARHDTLIKHDLFAPSYELIRQNVIEMKGAFNAGKKEYARWYLKETLSLCIDCHTRLPENYTSSFQNGELTVDAKKFGDPYDQGIAQLLVRRYIDAKESFVRNIQDDLISGNRLDLIFPFQQILMIETKVKKDPDNIGSFINDYLKKKTLPHEVESELTSWKKRLDIWKTEKVLKDGIQNEKELKAFIARRLTPLKVDSFNDSYKVDLLFASGLLSNYFFVNQNSPSAPELSYWLGWIEKRLKTEDFFSSGDLFLKQCIRKYPESPIAPKCLDEYKESVEFDFSGSAGTNIPDEVKQELSTLQNLLKASKKHKKK